MSYFLPVFLQLNMLSIKRIETGGAELETAILLFKEYFNELGENLSFQDVELELRDPLEKYGAPYGALFIAYFNNKPAGCIALQQINYITSTLSCLPGEVCEMKRLYIKPGFRQNKIGAELVKVLLKGATEKGYKVMVLDTLERLQPAIKLYQRYGFHNTSAYYINPLPGVVFMAKVLV